MFSFDFSGKIALVKEMQQMDDEDDKMSVTTTSSDIDEDSSITQDDSPRIKRRKTVIRITKRRKKQQQGEQQIQGAGGNLGSKFMKNFMDLANDLRKERVSETSNTSQGECVYQTVLKCCTSVKVAEIKT